MGEGRFISLEGGEGAGKSTQITALAARLEARGLRVIRTREPGGSPGAEAIRDLLVTGDVDRWSPMTEAFLLYAARIDHVERVIRPALKAGTWVISDRFADSSLAYQGYAGGLGAATVRDIHRQALGDFWPDLTLILDLPVAVGLARAGERMADAPGAEDRFERKGQDFHETMRQAFLDIAGKEPERCVIIDGTRDKDTVAQAVWDAVASRLEVTS